MTGNKCSKGKQKAGKGYKNERRNKGRGFHGVDGWVDVGRTWGTCFQKEEVSQDPSETTEKLCREGLGERHAGVVQKEQGCQRGCWALRETPGTRRCRLPQTMMRTLKIKLLDKEPGCEGREWGSPARLVPSVTAMLLFFIFLFYFIFYVNRTGSQESE